MDKSVPRPDAVDAIRVLAIAVIAYFGVGQLLRPFKAADWAYVAAIEGSFLAIPLLYARIEGLPILQVLGLRRLPLRSLIFVAIASVGSLWLLQGLTLIQERIYDYFGKREAVQESVKLLEQDLHRTLAYGQVVSLLMLSLIPAFCEETLFRGFLFSGFRNRWGAALALGVTSVLFGLMHIAWVKVPLMIVLGLYFGVLVLLTRSLWAGIVAHMTNNAAVVVVSLIEMRGYSLSAKPGPWWVYVTSALVFSGAMAVLWRDARGEAR